MLWATQPNVFMYFDNANANSPRFAPRLAAQIVECSLVRTPRMFEDSNTPGYFTLARTPNACSCRVSRHEYRADLALPPLTERTCSGCSQERKCSECSQQRACSRCSTRRFTKYTKTLKYSKINNVSLDITSTTMIFLFGIYVKSKTCFLLFSAQSKG